MKKHGLIIFAALALLACNRETPLPPADGAVIRLEPIISKATSTNFEEGDMIGLSIIRSDGSLYADNACLSYSDRVFSSSLKWYDDGGQSCTVSAYYPYIEGGVPQSFSVATDQSAGAGASDLMFAFKENVFPQGDALLTVFRHQMVQIVISIDNPGVRVGDVVVKGVRPSVKVIKASDGSLSVAADESAAPVDIKAETIEEGRKYRVIIAPQSGSFEIGVAVDGATLLTGTGEAELLSGYTYGVGIEILPDMMKASFAGEIENWEDGGSLIGTVVDESEAEELEGCIKYRGKTYTTGVFGGRKWMTEPMAYLPEGMSAVAAPAEGSVWYPYSTDGTVATALSDEESIKALGYLYSYEAVFGTAFTADNYNSFEGAQGICPKGWHVPTRAEYMELFGYSNKNVNAGESGPVTDDSALFWDQTLNYATIVKANEMGFNFVQSGTVVNGKYLTNVCASPKCTVEECLGKPSVNYLMTSSSNTITSSGVFQMFTGMTTFTENYSKGRLTLAYSAYNSGLQLRCVKNL